MTTNGKASKEINTPKEKKETAAMELLDKLSITPMRERNSEEVEMNSFCGSYKSA